MNHFLAVPIEPPERLMIQAALGDLSLPAKVSPPENWHVTVVFLGDLPAAKIPDLEAALRDAELGSPFALTTTGIGGFPDGQAARIIWLGIGDGRAELGRLHERANAAVVRVGLPVEQRAYAPHLTLSRPRRPESLSGLAALSLPAVAIPVKRLVLFRTLPTPAGGRYAEVFSVPFC